MNFELDPLVKSCLHISLFQNVKNVPELRKKVISGALQCCLVNPKLVLDPLQIVVATNKALVSSNRTTKSVFTEILFNLSISKNITQSLQRFGITDDCKDILLITIKEKDKSEIVNISEEIQGVEVPLDLLQQISDMELIKKEYKITTKEEEGTDILDSVISRIATKDFI